MRLQRRGPDRPPRAAAGSSTLPAVTRFLAIACPVGSLSNSSEAQKHGGRWWFVSGRCDLTASGCFEDPRPVPTDVLQSSVSAYGGAPVFGFRLAWRHSGTHAKPLS